ncbi:MAG: MMPL family transporter, partial [Nocardioidaceae bacterium]
GPSPGDPSRNPRRGSSEITSPLTMCGDDRSPPRCLLSRSGEVPPDPREARRWTVSGITAITDDLNSQLTRTLPLFIGAVIAVSFLLLMVVLGSIVVIMFPVLFGLSMDYEVFLLSRIREEYVRTGDNTESVARGLAGTGRVVTSAALIMVAVFLSFVASPIPSLQMLGLGLATAILIDATIIGMVLVPATMALSWARPIGGFPPGSTDSCPTSPSRGRPKSATSSVRDRRHSSV